MNDSTAPRSRANLEIKARCPDPGRAWAAAARVATARLGIDHQVDTYFRTAEGRLKLRESSLSGAHLVPYLRPDTPEAKRSDYELIPVPNPARTKALLTSILGVEGVVTKDREIYLHDNVRIHLDEVEGLGRFVELEAVFDGAPDGEDAEQSRVSTLMAELGIGEEDLVAVSYEDLLKEPTA